MKRRIYFVPITIFLNTLVFLAWQFTETKNFMPDHFLISYNALLEGRYWTLLTSVYSHSMGLHFFINMYVLHSFGGFLERFLGTWRFGFTYLICGIMGSLG
ncbi:MAG: rhomboid family intramembrane serine protease, partial [Bdellovibrionales bacterium]|nr:rhomboid family intramembrane serine protease [Bdellovibrionales bacterium]